MQKELQNICTGVYMYDIFIHVSIICNKILFNPTLYQWTKSFCFIITSYFCTKCNSIYIHIWLLTTTDPFLSKAKYVCISNCIQLYSELQFMHQNCIWIICMYYLNWYSNMRLVPGFRDPESVLILGQVTQYGNPYLICIIIILVELNYTDELKLDLLIFLNVWFIVLQKLKHHLMFNLFHFSYYLPVHKGTS